LLEPAARRRRAHRRTAPAARRAVFERHEEILGHDDFVPAAVERDPRPQDRVRVHALRRRVLVDAQPAHRSEIVQPDVVRVCPQRVIAVFEHEKPRLEQHAEAVFGMSQRLDRAGAIIDARAGRGHRARLDG
jgi:hypothetical protein